MTQTAVKTPLAKMRESFPHSYEKGNGWWTNDDNPHFDYCESPEGNIGINSWTGRAPEHVLAMGNPPLKMSDLFAKPGQWSKQQSRDKLDLLTLSDYLKLPWQFLESLGWRDGYTSINKMGRRTVCVKIGGYFNPDGTEQSKIRIRRSIYDEPRFLWVATSPGNPGVCGLLNLPDARKKGYLIACEGESDQATNQFHGFPCIGIPGADSVKHLDVSLLDGIPKIFIIEEPDQVRKNQEKGSGFYANMQQHLRANGYTGEILTIRFKLATGYKDPSNMHKAIYRACDQTEELPHLAEIKARFAESMSEAFELAIPEGNESLEHQEDEPQEVAPPAHPSTAEERESWLKDLLEVSPGVMSPIHKIVLMVIVLYSPIFDMDTGAWWQVDASHLCKFAAMNKKQFLRHLAYLTTSVGLFKKRNPKRRRKLPDGSEGEIVATDLYIRPAASIWLTYPSTWKVVDGTKERKHGGAQTPKVTCPSCGSPNIEIFCLDCKIMHRPNEEHTEEDDQSSESVESTAEVLPLEEKEENTSKKHSENTDIVLLENSLCKEHNIDTLETTEKIPLKVQVELSRVFSVETVAEQLNASIGAPCSKCGCTIYHHPQRFPDESWCCSCLPPRGVPDELWRWLKDHFSHTKVSWEVKS